MEDGGFILAPPGVTHGLDPVQASPLAKFYEIKFVINHNKLARVMQTVPMVYRRDDFISKLVELIVDQCSVPDVATPEIGADYLITLINYIYKTYGIQERVTSQYIDTTGYSQLSQEIVRFLEKKYIKDVPLQDVADAVGFNKNYICSVFKKDADMTIGACLTLIRIRKAAELISFSDMNLQQVAMATGFTNFSHFNRIFKKVVGIPPGQYRCSYTADMLIKGRDYIDRYIKAKDDGLYENDSFIASVMGGKLVPGGVAEELKNID